MLLGFLIIIDADKQHSALIVLEALDIPSVLDLLQSNTGILIPFQLNDHGRI